MSLTLQQVIGKNPFWVQKMLAVQAVLSSLRSDDVAVTGLEPNMEIPFSRAAVLWMFGAIGPRGILSQDAMMVVVQLYRQILLERGEYWERQLTDKKELTPLILTIADRKEVELGGHTNTCYDLQRCQRLKKAPLTFEGISYNLAVPVQLEWFRVQREITHGADAQAQRSVPGPHNPGHRVARPGGRPGGAGRPPLGPSDGPAGIGGNLRSQAARSVFEQAYGGDGDSGD